MRATIFKQQKRRFIQLLLFTIAAYIRHVKVAYHNIIIPVAVGIGGIHGKPVALAVSGYGVRGKLQWAGIFKVYKRFLRAALLVGEEGDGGNIKPAIFIKIPGYGFITAIHGEEVRLGKINLAVVDKQVQPVVGF